MAQSTKQITTISENQKQREAFLIYFNLGDDRSLVKVMQELGKKDVKISETSLAKWSKRFKWVKRVQMMDAEVMSRTEEILIKEATVKKSDILKTVKNTMIKYNQALLAGEVVPTAKDFHQMWEIQRKELGKDIEQSPDTKIEINPQILEVVREAEEKTLKIIREEIENEYGDELDCRAG